MATPYNFYGSLGAQNPWTSYIQSKQAQAQSPAPQPVAAPPPTQALRRPIAPNYQSVPQEIQRQQMQSPSQSAQLSADPQLTPTAGNNGAWGGALTYQENQRRAQSTGATSGGSGGANAGTMASQIGAGTAAKAQGSTRPGEAQGTGQAKTSFGRLFKPEAYDEVNRDPAAMINAYLEHVGANPNTGGSKMTQGLGDSMGLHWTMLNDTAGPENMGTSNYLDWAGAYLDNMRTPGGVAPSMSTVMNSVLDPSEDGIMFSNLYGEGMSAADQVGAVLQALQYGGKGLSPGLVMQSMLTRADALGEKYRAQAMTGQNDGHFGEYLRKNGF